MRYFKSEGYALSCRAVII